MDVSLLTRYNNYSYPAGGFTRARQRAEAAAPLRLAENPAAVNNGAQGGQYPARQIKRVGYTELNGSWDQFMLTRFVDLVERSTGSALDAGAIMRRYDADGDGLLNIQEQTAMIEGLTKAELERGDTPLTLSVVEQLWELTGQNEPKYAAGLPGAIRRYERLFFYEGRDIAEEDAVMAV